MPVLGDADIGGNHHHTGASSRSCSDGTQDAFHPCTGFDVQLAEPRHVVHGGVNAVDK